jgi:hypothetical protein
LPNDNITIRTRLLGAKRAAAEAKAVGTGVGGIGRSAKETDKHTRKMGKGFIYARKGIGPLRAGVTGLTGALGFGAGVGLIGAFKVMNDEARESQKTGRATSAVLKSTGASAWISRKQIEARATKLSEMAAVDDEVIQKSENMLLTFRDIRNEQGKGNKIFDRTNKAALDMAAGFTAAGKEMSPTDAALQLGKAVNDPVKGMTRLTRVGVTFTKQQTDQVAAMTKNGDKLGAQKVILAEINKEFGGQAKSQADPMKRLNVIMHNTAETIGLRLLPYIDKGAQKLGTWVKQVTNGTGAGGRFRDQVERIWKAAKPVVVWFGRAAKSVFQFASEHPDLVKMGVAALIGYKAFKKLGGMRLAKLVGWIVRLRKAGKAAKVAETIASNLGTLPAKSAGPLKRFGGSLISRLKASGGIAGKALGGALLTALDVFFATHTPNLSGSVWEKIIFPLGPKGGTVPGKGGIPKGYHQDPNGPLVTQGPGGKNIPISKDPGGSKVPRGHPVGRPRALVGAGGGAVIHNHFYVDGKEITHSVSRHTQDDRNRR